MIILILPFYALYFKVIRVVKVFKEDYKKKPLTLKQHKMLFKMSPDRFIFKQDKIVLNYELD